MEAKLVQSPRFSDVPPGRPAPPYFDPVQNAWVLSRYGDVLAALREPALRQAGPQKAPVQVREDVLNALSQSKISEWQGQIEPLADRFIGELPPGAVDLVSQVLRPWSLAVTAIVLGFDAETGRKLVGLQRHLSGNNANLPMPKGSCWSFRFVWLAVQRRIANARLQRLLRSVRVRGAQSLFLGLSQTLPDFLGNAWFALLQHPSQLARLRAEPHLAPKAMEELLRFSGPVHTLMREADRTLQLAGHHDCPRRTRGPESGFGESRPRALRRPRLSRHHAPERRPTGSRRRSAFLCRCVASPHGGAFGYPCIHRKADQGGTNRSRRLAARVNARLAIFLASPL